MKLTKAQQTTYPKLAYYLKNDMPKIMQVPAIVSAFKKIGGINKQKLRSALQWNQGPSLNISAMNVCGSFRPGISSHTLNISKTVVEEFEAGRGIRQARGGRVYAVGVTILHELMHWADDQNGNVRPDEEGNTFEKLVYGSVIPC